MYTHADMSDSSTTFNRKDWAAVKPCVAPERGASHHLASPPVEVVQGLGVGLDDLPGGAAGYVWLPWQGSWCCSTT